MKARVRYNMSGVEMHTAFKHGKEWKKVLDNHTIYMVDKTYTDGSIKEKFVAALDERKFSNTEEMLTTAAEEYVKIPREARGFMSCYGHVVYQVHPNLCVLCLKNGHVYWDRPLKVTAKDGNTYYYGGCTVVIYENKVFDPENGYLGMDINEYILMLKKDNPLLRMDPTLTYGTTTTAEATAICNELRANKKALDTYTAIYNSEGERIIP